MKQAHIPHWIAIATAAAACIAFALSPFAEHLDGVALDRGFATLRALAPVQDDDAIVIVGIDEGTFDHIEQPLALWHRPLGEIMSEIAKADPRAVALDIVLPKRSYDFVAEGLDRALLAGLLTLRKRAPLALAQTIEADGSLRPIYAPIVSVARPENLALALLPVDADGAVRRVLPAAGVSTDATPRPTLAAKIAQSLDIVLADGFINFALGAPYEYVPMQAILAASDTERGALRKRMRGRVVLLGSVLAFEDRHRVAVALAGWEPRSLDVPGLLIHAQTLRSALAGRVVEAIAPSAVWLLAGCALLMGYSCGATRRGTLIAIVLAAAALAAFLAALANDVFAPPSLLLFAVLTGLTARYARTGVMAMGERQMLKRAFAPYVSPKVMEDILSHRLTPELGGTRRMVTVLFSDIRNFTARSESRPPERIVWLLNEYFERMTTIVHEHGGTVDKFMGDGLMAFFGAPQPDQHAANAAVAAAKHMLQSLEELNERLTDNGEAAVAIGIGLHLGEAVVGHVGSSARYEYTVIGDVVNVASRLEGLSKGVGYPLVVSEEVYAAAGDASFDALGAQPIKGHEPVPVFGWQPGECS